MDEVSRVLPKDGLRVGVIGDTSDFCPLVPELIAKAVATIRDVTVVTGGTSGVPEHFAAAFTRERYASAGSSFSSQPTRVFHILPTVCRRGETDHSSNGTETTLYAGYDMAERRAIFGGVCDVYIVIGGGPGSSDEMRHAISNGKAVIPIACSGGAAADGCVQRHAQKFADWGTPSVKAFATAPTEDWDCVTCGSSQVVDVAFAVVRLIAAVPRH